MRTLRLYLLIEQRQRSKMRRQRSFRQRAGRLGIGLGALIGLALVLASLLGVLAYADLTRDLPSPAAVSALLDAPSGALLEPTRIYDRSGQHLLLALENPGVARRSLPVDTGQAEHLSPELVRVAVAALDPGFWSHPGINLNDLTGAAPATLAERLISDLVLDNEAPSLQRSLRLRLLAAQLTAHYGRQQVLAWFLNSANYGHLAFGADAAAHLYLGKPASQLTLGESALLIAVLKAPALNPLDAPEAARNAQRQLLGQLLVQGRLSAAEVDQARQEPLEFSKSPAPPENPAQAYTNLVLEQLAGKFGLDRLERGGLVVTTTLDYDLQQQLVCTARLQLLHLQNDTGDIPQPSMDLCPAGRLLPALSSAKGFPPGLVASGMILDPQTGQILAYIGDTTLDAGEASTQAAHASGSLLTPFIYLAGFTRGMGPATLVWDVPTSLPTTASQKTNPDLKFHGPQRLRLALANDYLAPAAQLLAQIGPSNVWSLAEPFGLPDLSAEPLPFDGGDITPIQAAQAYSVFADQGILTGQNVASPGEAARLQSSAVLCVADKSGTVLLDWSQPVSRSIISPPLAYLVNNILSDESARWPSLGYPNPLEIGRPAAARYGQISAGSGVWAVGYTPQRLAAVWFGLSQAGLARIGQEGVPSGPLDPRLPAGLWHALMQYVSRDLPAAGWPAPAGISTQDVCDPSGLLPTAACPNVVSEVFLTGNEPTGPDTLYRTFQINRETGRLATVFTPPALVESHTYLMVPPEARPWAEATGLAVPPEQYDIIQPVGTLPDVKIDAPAQFSAVHGAVAITGSAGGDNFVSYRLQAGQGLNPQNWLQVGEEVKTPVSGGSLGTWDSRQVPDGLYALRLLVSRTGQGVDLAVIQVTVDNTPPELTLLYPADGQSLTAPSTGVVTFQARASDVVGLERVEWWVDGALAGDQTQAPFSFLWPASPGAHTLQVRARDRAGNEVQSAVVSFTVR
jgi:membrane peptidoglycan carboxypeptidase